MLNTSNHWGEQRFRARDRRKFVEAGYPVHAGFRPKRSCQRYSRRWRPETEVTSICKGPPFPRNSPAFRIAD